MKASGACQTRTRAAAELDADGGIAFLVENSFVKTKQKDSCFRNQPEKAYWLSD